MKDLYDHGRHYDALFHGPKDLPFYQRQLEAYGGPVLELGCGTGRLIVPLAAGGAEVTGIDQAAGMLEVARQRAARAGVAVRFEQADIRDYALGRKFQLIVIANNSLCHLLDRKAVEGCLRCTREHLGEGGRFVIDIFTPSPAFLARDGSEPYTLGEYEDPDEGGKVVVTETRRYDAATQVNHSLWRFENNVTGKSWEIPFPLRMFFPQEIDALLEYNGFTIEQKYGEYDESPFGPSSRKQLIVCG